MKTIQTNDAGGIIWNNIPISFFKKTPNKQVDHYFNATEIMIQETECGWKFQVPATDNPSMVGVMIPVQSLEVEVMVDNSPLDLYKSKKYYYAPARELERLLELNPHDYNDLERPIVHMIDKDKAFAWSCPNECIISSFIYQYQWHINFTAIAWEDITFFVDQSSNALINIQRHLPNKKEVLINEATSIKFMQNALLSGAKPRKHPNSPHPLIQEARQIQLELKNHHLDSVIIGSMARRLNSVPVDVNDIDLMIRDKDQLNATISILESFADRISLHDMHAKFISKDYTIDVCYDNFNIMSGAGHLITRHGLSYLGVEGLLWLYMINRFACEIDEHSDEYKDHVNNAITSLCRTYSLGEFALIPHGRTIPDYSAVCFDLCLLLSESKLEYRDIRINKPFLVRQFRKEDEFFYVIVNLGSCCDAEIVIDQIPTTATWQDISGSTKIIKPIPDQNFSVIHISQVSLPGVLRCQRLQ